VPDNVPDDVPDDDVWHGLPDDVPGHVPPDDIPDGGPGHAVRRGLVDVLVAEVARDYKIEPQKARGMISACVAGDARIGAMIQGGCALADIRRTAAYRALRKEARRRVYASLRRYRDAAEDGERYQKALEALEALAGGARYDPNLIGSILGSHVSTRERLRDADAGAFCRLLREFTAGAAHVLDVGCGVHPLMLTPDFYARTGRYVAADRDPQSIALVNAYAQGYHIPQLTGIVWEMGNGWQALEARTGIPVYDAALVMKVVPVVARQAPALLDVLAELPARKALFTACRESMTKRVSIQRRERAALDAFISSSPFIKSAPVETESEFGWIVAPRGSPGIPLPGHIHGHIHGPPPRTPPEC